MINNTESGEETGESWILKRLNETPQEYVSFRTLDRHSIEDGGDVRYVPDLGRKLHCLEDDGCVERQDPNVTNFYFASFRITERGQKSLEIEKRLFHS